MKKKITVNNSFQKDYVYFLTEPIGKNFRSDFKPDLTPKQMLALGVFGGVYFSDKPTEYPKDWFTRAKLSVDKQAHRELNYFNINASQPMSVWIEKGWINENDPRGWFEWYARYHM